MNHFYKQSIIEKRISTETNIQARSFRQEWVRKLMEQEIYLDLSACLAYQLSNLKDTIRDSSIKESSEIVSPSIHTLVEESKHVVWEKDELKYGDIAILKTICHFWSIRTPILMERSSFMLFGDD